MTDPGWRAIIGSSSIMSLALLGDALLYAVPSVAPAKLHHRLVAVSLAFGLIYRLVDHRTAARRV